MATETTWNPQTHEDYLRLKGRTVYAADGQEVGKLHAIFHPPLEMPEARGHHYFLVETGTLAPKYGEDVLYLSEELLGEVRDDRIILTVPSAELKGDLIRAPHNLASFDRK